MIQFRVMYRGIRWHNSIRGKIVLSFNEYCDKNPIVYGGFERRYFHFIPRPLPPLETSKYSTDRTHIQA